jgi:hypothetical protein
MIANASVYTINIMEGKGSLKPLTLDERAVILAATIEIDLDYFTRRPLSMFG